MHVYSALMPETSIGAARDLLRVTAPATASLVILRATITQTGSETSDQVAAVIRRASTDGTGTANTPLAYSAQSPAFPGTAAHNLTTGATAGDELYQEGFNLVNGFLWVPVPEERIIVPAGTTNRCVLRLDTAPASATSIIACLVIGVVG